MADITITKSYLQGKVVVNGTSRAGLLWIAKNFVDGGLKPVTVDRETVGDTIELMRQQGLDVQDNS